MKLAKVAVSLGIISILAGCGEADTASSHIAKAKSFQSHEVDAKLIELKNAVKLESRNAEARFLLGETYLSQGFASGAIKELEKAHEYSYDLNKLIPLLARAYSISSSDEDVIDLNKHLNTLNNESAVVYLAYKTLAEIRLGSVENAKNVVSQSESLISGSAYYHLASAYLAMGEADLDSAQNNVEKTLTILPNQYDAILLLGQINSAKGEHNQATINFTKYAEAQPKSSIIVLFLAQSLLKEEKYLEAEKYADTILASAPNQPFANYVKAMSQFELKEYLLAKEHAELALKSNFNQAQLKLVAGISSYFLGNYEQSHSHLESLIPHLTAEHPARKMFAMSQLQLGMLEDIPETLQGFNATTEEDDKFLSTLSYQMAQLGAVDKAKVIAKKAANTSSDNAEQNMREGILKLMLNDPSGMQNLQDAVNINPDMRGAEIALAYAAIQANDLEQAKEIGTRWKEKNPDKLGGFNVLAAVYLKQGNIDLAKEEMHQSLKVSGKNLFALLELTNLAMLEDDKAEAVRLSDFSIAEFPKNTKVLRQYYSIRQDDAAFEKIKSVYTSDTKNLSTALLYSELLVNTKQFNEAISILDTFENTVKSPKQQWKLKVASQNGAGNNNKALLLLEEWMDVNPYHIEPVVMLSDYYGRKQDLSKALDVINKALSGVHNDNKMLMLGKMQLLIDKEDTYQAKEYFKELKADNIHGVLSEGIEGKIALLDKDYEKASKLLAKFYNDNPLAKNALLLNKALQGVNKYSAANDMLEYHLSKNDKDHNVRLVLANNYIGSSPEKAISEYKKILEDHPNSVMVLNNIAWLSMEAGELESALSYSESAHKLVPEDVNVIDTKAMILFKMGRNGEALRHLGKAHDLSKGRNNPVSINYAEVLIASNRSQSALKILNAIKPKNKQETARINQLKALSK